MTADFYKAYLEAEANKEHLRKQLFYIMNPNKFRACEYLIRKHEKRGDKIIVFSDNIFALKTYAAKLRRHFVCGN